MKEGSEIKGLMSMTGFGSTQGSVAGWSWSGDIRAVNGRSLDLRLRLPDVDGLEAEVRKSLQARLARGNVTVNLRLQREEGAQTASVNAAGLSQALGIISEIEAAAQAAGVTTVSVKPTDVATMRGVVELGDPASADDSKELKAALLNGLGEALETFVADRAREGAALGAVLSEQITRVENLTQAAANAVGDRDLAARAAMDRNLARLLDATEVPDEARLLQELALVAVKTDVTEELDRLAAHVEAARGLLEEKGPVGRKLDFLMQEFNREANTLCSKAQSTTLTAIGLDLKAVIDQMREQVQNTE